MQSDHIWLIKTLKNGMWIAYHLISDLGKCYFVFNILIYNFQLKFIEKITTSISIHNLIYYLCTIKQVIKPRQCLYSVIIATQ